MTYTKTDHSKRDLTRGSVDAHLANLTVPMVWGIIAFMAISLADAYFLGRLGTGPLAAISFTFPVVFTFSTLAIGLGAGATSVVSRAIGRNDRKRMRRLSTDALILAVLIVIIVCIPGWFLIDPLFRMLGAEGAILDDIRIYMRIWYLGMPFLVVPIVANNLIRSNGDAFMPSMIMTVAAVVNVGLDPWFIFGGFGLPAMGIAGAAWASLAARAITFVFSLAILIWRERLLDLTIPPLQELLESWRRVLSVGLPAALGNMMNPVGVALVTAILATYGSENVAAFGVATRIEAFASIPLFALSAAIGPIGGQNWGARQPERIWRALVLSFVFSLIWAVVLVLAAWFGGRMLAQAFTSDAAIAEQIAHYLLIVSSSLAGYGVVVVTSACCNAIGYPLRGFTLYGIRMLVFYVPFAWLASNWFGVTGVFWAIWFTNVCAGVLGLLMIVHVFRTARLDV